MRLHWTLGLRAIVFSALNWWHVRLGEEMSRLGCERPLRVTERVWEPGRA